MAEITTRTTGQTPDKSGHVRPHNPDGHGHTPLSVSGCPDAGLSEFEAMETKDGRLFLFAGAEPYTRKDGTATTLLCWRGSCLVCGAGFTVKTPAGVEGSKAFGRKHCDTHKLKPEQVGTLWAQARKRGRP